MDMENSKDFHEKDDFLFEEEEKNDKNWVSIIKKFAYFLSYFVFSFIFFLLIITAIIKAQTNSILVNQKDGSFFKFNEKASENCDWINNWEHLEENLKESLKSWIKKNVSFSSKNLPFLISSPEPVNLLITGLPGTGKSFFAKKFLEENCSYYCENPDLGVVHYVGSSTKTYDKIKLELEKIIKLKKDESKKVIAFLIDEVDMVASSRDDGHSSNLETTNNLIKFSDFLLGISKKENIKILIIATTNIIDKIDVAVKRRFKIVEFKPINLENANKTFDFIINQKKDELISLQKDERGISLIEGFFDENNENLVLLQKKFNEIKEKTFLSSTKFNSLSVSAISSSLNESIYQEEEAVEKNSLFDYQAFHENLLGKINQNRPHIRRMNF